jgi:hypothetical protein
MTTLRDRIVSFRGLRKRCPKFRRRPDVEDPATQRDLLRRRSGVQGLQARADRARLRVSLKRLVDPKVRSPNVFIVRGKFVGLNEAVAKAGGKLDYDAEIEGLRALDRYTLQLKFVDADFTFLPF